VGAGEVEAVILQLQSTPVSLQLQDSSLNAGFSL
jgi:hypothetical protein